MSIEIKLRRGTTTQHSSFTGAAYEITLDTDKQVPVIHDGSTAGGFPLASETHDHDADYADIAHDHDADYSALGHSHSEYLDKSAGGTVSAQVVFSGDKPTISDGTTQYDVGYLQMPIQAVAGGRTLVAADAGKMLVVASGNITLPANASVAYPTGTSVAIYNNSGGSITISINSDTLTLVGTGTIGTRTLANYGSATVVKIDSTSWIISGVGIS